MDTLTRAPQHPADSVQEAESYPILLVVPPFQDLTRPSLGVSQLKANVQQVGATAEVVYLNLRFAERIGIDLYEAVSNSTTSVFLGEVVFSHILFDRGEEDIERYCKEILATNPGWVKSFSEGLRKSVIDDSLPELLHRLIRDARAFCDESVDELIAKKPWMVGLTSSFQQNCSSLAVLQELKRRRPDILAAMGGANCEAEMGEELFARFPFLDFVGQGECDISFVALIRALREGGSGGGIPGVLSRRGPAGAQAAPLTSEDLDALPHPSFEDFFRQLDRWAMKGRIKAGLIMETSRGCWWGAKHHCTFCGLNGQGMGFRSKNPERVLGEIAAQVERYGIDRIEVVDNILDMQYFKSVLPHLASHPVADFAYETKANLSRDQVRLLSRARIRWIQPGIESLSDETLALMRKGIRQLENIQLLKWCTEDGVRVFWNYLFGFPGENEDEIARISSDIETLHHLQPPTGASTLHLDRFSPYFQNPEEWDIAPIYPMAPYFHIYPFPDESVRRIAYIYQCDFFVEKAATKTFQDLRTVVYSWRDGHAGAHLASIPLAGSLLLLDTRACATRFVRRLTGLSRRIYEFCERARGEKVIVREFSSDAEPEDVREILAFLTANFLVLKVNDRYLSLATAPIHEYRRYAEIFPGGAVTGVALHRRILRWLWGMVTLQVPPKVLAEAVRRKLGGLRAAATTSTLRLAYRLLARPQSSVGSQNLDDPLSVSLAGRSVLTVGEEHESGPSAAGLAQTRIRQIPVDSGSGDRDSQTRH